MRKRMTNNNTTTPISAGRRMSMTVIRKFLLLSVVLILISGLLLSKGRSTRTSDYENKETQQTKRVTSEHWKHPEERFTGNDCFGVGHDCHRYENNNDTNEQHRSKQIEAESSSESSHGVRVFIFILVVVFATGIISAIIRLIQLSMMEQNRQLMGDLSGESNRKNDEDEFQTNGNIEYEDDVGGETGVVTSSPVPTTISAAIPVPTSNAGETSGKTNEEEIDFTSKNVSKSGKDNDETIFEIV